MAAPRQGTGYINWSAFVNANRGGAQRVADDLSRPQEEGMAGADVNLTAGQEEFNRDVGANTFDGDPTRLRTRSDFDPSMAYTGPGGIEGYTNFDAGQRTAKDAAAGASRLADAYSRIGLLGDTYGKNNPTYTQGQQGFDSALIGSVGQGRFEKTAKDSKSLLQRFSDASTGAQSTVANARTTGAANQASVFANAMNQIPTGWGGGGQGRTYNLQAATQVAGPKGKKSKNVGQRLGDAVGWVERTVGGG